MTKTIPGGAISDLMADLRGEVLRPSQQGYDDARRVWNGMIDRRPALIARCAGVADVVRTVRFVREHGGVVSVRGGGHNIAGHAVCDGGVMIDMSRMKGVRVDPARRTARAQAGLTLGELDHETQAFGLACPAGVVSTTGIAGLTLGGGTGRLARSLGLTIDNLLSADVVTADGRFVTASAEENADLFWGLRGGGGNFGVVTSFEYRLHDVGPLVVGGLALYPAERAREILRFYRDYTSSAPDRLGSECLFITMPDLPMVPEELQNKQMVSLGLCYVGSIDEGQRIVEAVRSATRPALDTLGVLPYTVIQRLYDPFAPSGRRYYMKSGHLARFDDDVVDAIVSHAAAVTSPLSMVMVTHIGGAVRRAEEGATAFSHREAEYNFEAVAAWTDPRESERHVGWARELGAAMQPFSKGVYVNMLGDEGEDRVRAAYSPAAYERLVALKNKYDPTNMFRQNQNIKPSV